MANYDWEKKSIFKRWWFWVMILAIVLLATATKINNSQPVTAPAKTAQPSVNMKSDDATRQTADEKAKEDEKAKQDAEFEKTQKEIEQKNKADAEAAAKLKAEQDKQKAANAITSEDGAVSVTDAKFEKGDYGITYITGTAKNNTDSDLQYVMVSISLYDKDGNQVGSTQDAVTSLDASGTWKFKAVALQQNAVKFKIKEITHL